MTTSSGTSTPATRLRGYEFYEYPAPSSIGTSIASPPVQASATRLGSALFDRFSLAILPFATAAGFAAPAWPRQKLCIYSGGDSSRSAIIGITAVSDFWEFTQESADLEEVRALNRLLDLPAAEGLAIEFPDF